MDDQTRDLHVKIAEIVERHIAKPLTMPIFHQMLGEIGTEILHGYGVLNDSHVIVPVHEIHEGREWNGYRGLMQGHVDGLFDECYLHWTKGH